MYVCVNLRSEIKTFLSWLKLYPKTGKIPCFHEKLSRRRRKEQGKGTRSPRKLPPDLLCAADGVSPIFIDTPSSAVLEKGDKGSSTFSNLIRFYTSSPVNSHCLPGKDT